MGARCKTTTPRKRLQRYSIFVLFIYLTRRKKKEAYASKKERRLISIYLFNQFVKSFMKKSQHIVISIKNLQKDAKSS
jgi:hypothetical protein